MIIPYMSRWVWSWWGKRWCMCALYKHVLYMHALQNSHKTWKCKIVKASSYWSFGVKQQSLTSLLIYQTLFLVVFEYFYDVYLFEIKHVCNLNWPKWPSEVLSYKWRKLGIIYFILDTKISEESVFKQVYSSTCSTKELSISMTTILHVVKEGLLSYCDKVYSLRTHYSDSEPTNIFSFSVMLRA
jgi:hypothetical protein